MLKYVPQKEFLSLLMTGDGEAIGTKFGITFRGVWVWRMKDYIDKSFMNLFDANLLFEDFKNKGMAFPLEANELFEDELIIRTKVYQMVMSKIISNHKSLYTNLKISIKMNQNKNLNNNKS